MSGTHYHLLQILHPCKCVYCCIIGQIKMMMTMMMIYAKIRAAVFRLKLCTLNMSLRNGDSVVNNNGRWRSSLLNTPANGRCYLYTQLTTRPSTVMLWLEPNYCDLSWISCKRVPPAVQQMTRFRLTERIARSVCASRASFEKQTEYGQPNYKWRLPQ